MPEPLGYITAIMRAGEPPEPDGWMRLPSFPRLYQTPHAATAALPRLANIMGLAPGEQLVVLELHPLAAANE